MTIYTGVKAIPGPLSASVVCIGNFDGLHRGHQALVEKALELAAAHRCPSVVYTFTPHPAQVLAPGSDHKCLFSRKYLEELLRRMGVDILIFEPFTKEFAGLSAPEFVTGHLVAPLHPKAIVVGQNFNFGRGRAGSVALLSQLGPRHGFAVEGIAPVSVNGEIVSSSRIRQAVQAGDMPMVEALLGRPFSIDGTVVTGAGRGRKIGVATANMEIKELIQPKRGVYATYVELAGGARFASVSNLGVAPTFSRTGELALETHILDQKMDLVGTEMRVHFLSYLREERRFADAGELVAQIQRDIAQARAVWATRGEMGGLRS